MSGSSLWMQWSWEPSVLLGLGLAATLYLLSVFPLRRRLGVAPTGAPVQVAFFLAGLLTIFIALVSPLNFLADGYLFSAHMVQHLLLILIMPPLLLVGTPDWLLRPLLGWPPITVVAQGLTHPLVAFGLFNTNLWLWHHPGLYQRSLESLPVHILMHLLFMATAIVGWWPVLSPLPELQLQSYPARMAYLFVQALSNTALSALLIFSFRVLYPAYAAVPRLWGLSPLEDQQLGGLLMWVPGGLLYLSALSVLFFRWFRGNEIEEDITESTDLLA